MSKFMTAVKTFVKGEEGATMVEYALMVALIAVVCIATVTTLGSTLSAKFTAITTAL
jgi:pilus assembly protein Flp/PilA